MAPGRPLLQFLGGFGLQIGRVDVAELTLLSLNGAEGRECQPPERRQQRGAPDMGHFVSLLNNEKDRIVNANRSRLQSHYHITSELSAFSGGQARPRTPSNPQHRL